MDWKIVFYKLLGVALFVIGIGFFVSAGIDFLSNKPDIEPLTVTSAKVPIFERDRRRNNAANVLTVKVVEDSPNELILEVDYQIADHSSEKMSACGGVHNDDFGYQWSCRPVNVFSGRHTMYLSMSTARNRAGSVECSEQVAVKIYKNNKGGALFTDYYDYKKVWLKDKENYSNRIKQYKQYCSTLESEKRKMQVLPDPVEVISLEEKEYLADWKAVIKRPDWWDAIEAKDYQAFNSQDLYLIRLELITSNKANTLEYINQNRSYIKTMYKIVKQSFDFPKVAAEAINLMSQSDVRDIDKHDIYKFYQKYLDNVEYRSCSICLPNDSSWNNTLTLANSYSNKKNYQAALDTLLDYLDRKQDILQEEERSRSGFYIKEYEDKLRQQKEVIDIVQSGLMKLMSTEMNLQERKQYNNKINYCRSIDPNGCTQFEFVDE